MCTDAKKQIFASQKMKICNTMIAHNADRVRYEALRNYLINRYALTDFNINF